jgi:hypothetical protein
MTPADFERILRQPGYSVDGGVSGQNAPTLRRDGQGATEAQKGHCAIPSSSRLSLWRSERDFMRAVIAECDLRAIGQPKYGLVYHIPNENSYRQPGVRAGMPDLALSVASGKFHGWYCELKITGGKLSEKQRTMHDRLRMEGYRVVVVWDSVDEVMREIEEYLERNK